MPLTFEAVVQMLSHARDSKAAADASAAVVVGKQSALDKAHAELETAVEQAEKDASQLDLDRKAFQAAADSFLQVQNDIQPVSSPAVSGPAPSPPAPAAPL